MTNTQSTLPITPDFRKIIPLAVLFGGNGNSYTIPTQSSICVYTHIFQNVGCLSGKELKKIRQHLMSRAMENLFLLIFETCALDY
jgi:hypothetical protein